MLAAATFVYRQCPRRSPRPTRCWVLQSRSLTANLEWLTARGVSFERIAGLPLDAAGILTTPDGAQVAWFRDPDGNLLSMVQYA